MIFPFGKLPLSGLFHGYVKEPDGQHWNPGLWRLDDDHCYTGTRRFCSQLFWSNMDDFMVCFSKLSQQIISADVKSMFIMFYLLQDEFVGRAFLPGWALVATTGPGKRTPWSSPSNWAARWSGEAPGTAVFLLGDTLWLTNNEKSHFFMGKSTRNGDFPYLC